MRERDDTSRTWIGVRRILDLEETGGIEEVSRMMMLKDRVC